VLIDFLYSGPNGFGNGDASPVRYRSGSSAASAQTGCTPEYLNNRILLGFQCDRLGDLPGALRILEVCPKLKNPVAISRFRLLIQDLTCVRKSERSGVRIGHAVRSRIPRLALPRKLKHMNRVVRLSQ